MQKSNIPNKLKNAKCSQKSGQPQMPREKLTVGQKAADVITTFGGSWKFIIIVLSYIGLWIVVNSIPWEYKWDKWPFIMLNLTLSCLAAMQAPIILMSQKRGNERDRLNQRYDYLVNRKAEREISTIMKDLKKIKKRLDLT
ncbi:DUF1003 domain-containing protein [Patescibacteria group bacterium]|nr:DUF1003 domain-containing protein [Patescibacteria group bacterium]